MDKKETSLSRKRWIYELSRLTVQQYREEENADDLGQSLGAPATPVAAIP